jgi:hypothetical protein
VRLARWQALKLHLEASHERFTFHFSGDEPGTVPEIYVDVVTAPPGGPPPEKPAQGRKGADAKVR